MISEEIYTTNYRSCYDIYAYISPSKKWETMMHWSVGSICEGIWAIWYIPKRYPLISMYHWSAGWCLYTSHARDESTTMTCATSLIIRKFVVVEEQLYTGQYGERSQDMICNNQLWVHWSNDITYLVRFGRIGIDWTRCWVDSTKCTHDMHITFSFFWLVDRSYQLRQW